MSTHIRNNSKTCTCIYSIKAKKKAKLCNRKKKRVKHQKQTEKQNSYTFVIFNKRKCKGRVLNKSIGQIQNLKTSCSNNSLLSDISESQNFCKGQHLGSNPHFAAQETFPLLQPLLGLAHYLNTEKKTNSFPNAFNYLVIQVYA